MTPEEKELLLKDLCARLPYGQIVQISLFRNDGRKRDIDLDPHVTENIGELVDKYNVLPYLRPMSSMTEEESVELSNIISEWFDKEMFFLTEEPFLEYALTKINYSISPLLFDWLNKNHFDYRGLIPKKLAIAVTKENNPYK